MNRVRQSLILVVLALLLVAPLSLNAQALDPGEDDGRLNMAYWMDGMGLYCVDAARNPANTYANGGGFLLLAPDKADGSEMLWIPEADIVAGIAAVEETGEYAMLGQAAPGSWFDPQPAIYYLPSGEFQINIAKSSVDDLREGKLYTFYWTECRKVNPETGAAPAVATVPAVPAATEAVCVLRTLTQNAVLQ